MAQTIVDTLMQEHKVVLSILSELANKGVSGREQKYSSLKENLMPHVIGEEQVLYPRLKEVTETRDIAFEAIEEHSAVKTLLKPARWCIYVRRGGLGGEAEGDPGEPATPHP